MKPKIRVAVADDHSIFLDGLCRLLSLEDDVDVVAQVKDGSEVLAIVNQHQPDILLLDLNMPRIDGLVVLRQLQATDSKTRVIVLTASDEKNDLVQALALGSVGIVLKQTATDRLMDGIRRVYAGEFLLDSHSIAALFRGSGASVPPQTAHAPQSLKQGPPMLSPREREIVALVSQGFKNADIAGKLQISGQTAKNHLHNIFEKLGVRDRLELALFSVEQGLSARSGSAFDKWS